MPRYLRLFSILACAACTFAFAGDAAPRIVDGTEVPESEYPTVGKVGIAGFGHICTGTLISPRHVLTAAHCAQDFFTGGNLPDNAGRFTLGGREYRTARVYVHPTYTGRLFSREEVDYTADDRAFDCAIFELNETVENVTPTPIYRLQPSVGTPVVIAGYGQIGTGKKGETNRTPKEGTIHFGANTIEFVTASAIGWTFLPGEVGTAHGDSGGPAFIDVGGVLHVAGVTSTGFNPTGKITSYGDINIDTRIDSVAPWIDSILNNGSSNVPPALTGLLITPEIAVADQEVRFEASAIDADHQKLYYMWDFGDGDARRGQSVTHAFPFPGTYIVNLTVSDGITSVTEPKEVTVVELTRGELTIDKMSLAVNFKFGFRDSAVIQGRLDPSLKGKELTNINVRLEVGGVEYVFLLDEKGVGTLYKGGPTLTLDPERLTFNVKLKDDTFFPDWDDEGIRDQDANNLAVRMSVALTLHGGIYEGTRILQYSARAGKTGRAK